MRAAVFSEPNKPLTIQEFHMPRPKAGEVLIKIKGFPPLFFVLFLIVLFRDLQTLNPQELHYFFVVVVI